MAANGISPSIIPTEFCADVVRQQSRSLVHSIKGGSATDCTEALLATNRNVTFSNSTISTGENLLLVAKISFIGSRLILFPKALLPLEYSSSKVIFN
jgi:hypothetical protein